MRIRSIHIGRWIGSGFKVNHNWNVWARTEVMWYSSFPYQTQHHQAPQKSHKGKRSTGKIHVWWVDSRGRKSAEGWVSISKQFVTRDYHVAKNCHAFISHRITSPQLLIWMCTMRIEFTLPQMRIQCEFLVYWRKVTCEWACRDACQQQLHTCQGRIMVFLNPRQANSLYSKCCCGIAKCLLYSGKWKM